jgi:[acyl-carrier-protein] S-malonyltransferase
MFEGPQEELTRTINAQPAILAVSVACLKTMAETLGPDDIPSPSFVAGHSLGEYTALVAASVVGISDAARLVRERGRLMQQASDNRTGGMAAVLGLDELALEEVCRETGATISNINADDQFVIAGDRVALARAMDLAALRGAKRLIRLQVSGAFHTPLMQSAADGMADVLSGLEFRDPQVPVVANCTGRPLKTANAIKAELIQQISGCVQWQRSVRYMADAGVTDFYEIGPGRVLTAMVKRITTDARVTDFSDRTLLAAEATAVV